MAREADAALQAKVLLVGFVSAFIGAVLLAVKSMMFGSLSKAGIVVALFIGLAAILLLDNRYWLLLPILSFANLSIPGLPFTGTELGCLTITAVHAVRLVLRRDSQRVRSFRIFVTFPLLFWMAFIFLLNPVGLAMFGSHTIGGRFYFDIVVGFSAFLSLASLCIDEKDARLLFYATLLSLLFAVTRDVVFPRPDPDALVFSNTGLEQEVSARYAFITCSAVFMLLFAKWSIRDVMVSPIRMSVLVLLALLTIYSGKRQAFGAIVLVPFFRMILKRKDVILTCAMGMLASMVLALAVIGDGVWFSLPLSAKRVVAVVAPRYEEETAGGIHDLFRQRMRKHAYAVIRENPYLGRRGFAMDLEDTRWLNFGGGYSSLFAGHAYAGNWHSMWLAYACDFGFPGLFFAIFLWVYLFRFILHGNRLVARGVFLPACFLFFSYQLLVALAFSWVSGHASHSTCDTWIRYGMLLALFNGYRSCCSSGEGVRSDVCHFSSVPQRVIAIGSLPVEERA